ncbi:helix-turn-helix domain-containing protein, partial [Pseudomonas aeruginosa]
MGAGQGWEGCAFTGMILSRVAVMARLADYSNDEGVSWPAIETIRRQIGARSESTVKSAIAELAKEGWLTKEERKVVMVELAVVAMAVQVVVAMVV